VDLVFYIFSAREDSHTKSKGNVFMKTPTITAYLRPTCRASVGVRAVLAKYELAFEERNVASDVASRSDMVRRSGQGFSPCVDVDGHMLADVTGDDVEVYLLTAGLVKPTDARTDAPTNRGGAVVNLA
jgi:glutaredoxin